MFFGIWLKMGEAESSAKPAPFMPAGSSSRVLNRSCQQEVEAAHPAPARGRGKRNASGSGMPAGSGSCPSSASSGAVEANCQQEAEAVQAGKMVLKTEALGLSDCDSDGIPSFMVSFW